MSKNINRKKAEIKANYDFELAMLGYFDKLEKIEPQEISKTLKNIDRGFLDNIHEISKSKFVNEIRRSIQFLHAVGFYLKAHNCLVEKLHKNGGIIVNGDYDTIRYK